MAGREVKWKGFGRKGLWCYGGIILAYMSRGTDKALVNNNNNNNIMDVMFALEQAMKAQRGSRGIVLVFL
jgi:hypothetical protein